jgi:hypothetical protein
MALSWTAHLLLASPRSHCSVAERHPIVQRHVRRICTLGPVLGPHPTGQQRTTAGRSGHQTLAETAGRCLYSSVTLYGADGPQWSASLPTRQSVPRHVRRCGIQLQWRNQRFDVARGIA